MVRQAPRDWPKSAARLAYHVIEMDPEEVKQFAQDMYKARLAVKYCRICGNLTDHEICSICEDATRDQSTVCVVKDARDVMALERVREFHGVYHVLGGTISPLDGVGPDDIRVKELLGRVKEGNIKGTSFWRPIRMFKARRRLYISQSSWSPLT